MTMEGGAPLSEIVRTLTGLGMTLFFVLSGFIIHYNYNTTGHCLRCSTDLVPVK